jgi:hypothetical protein
VSRLQGFVSEQGRSRTSPFAKCSEKSDSKEELTSVPTPCGGNAGFLVPSKDGGYEDHRSNLAVPDRVLIIVPLSCPTIPPQLSGSCLQFVKTQLL